MATHTQITDALAVEVKAATELIVEELTETHPGEATEYRGRLHDFLVAIEDTDTKAECKQLWVDELDYWQSIESGVYGARSRVVNEIIARLESPPSNSEVAATLHKTAIFQ